MMTVKRTTAGVATAVVVLAAVAAMTALTRAATGGQAATWKSTAIGRGAPATPTAAAYQEATRAQVDPSTVRVLGSAGAGKNRVTLLRGLRADGATCLAARTSSVTGSFNCLGAATDAYALVYFATTGGSSLAGVDHATVIGVARAGINRVRFTTPSGTHDLAVGPGRVFSYVAVDAAAVPTSLIAVGNRGEEVQRFQLEAAAPRQE